MTLDLDKSAVIFFLIFLTWGLPCIVQPISVPHGYVVLGWIMQDIHRLFLIVFFINSRIDARAGTMVEILSGWTMQDSPHKYRYALLYSNMLCVTQIHIPQSL